MSLPTLRPEFHDIAKRVNNWGRWGADDEIGTLNLITDEVVREAAATVRTGPPRPPRAPPPAGRGTDRDDPRTGQSAARHGADQPGALRPRHRRVQRRRGDHGPPGGDPLGRPHPCLALREALQRPPGRHDHPARRRRVQRHRQAAAHRLAGRTARRRARTGRGPPRRRTRRDTRRPGRGRGVGGHAGARRRHRRSYGPARSRCISRATSTGTGIRRPALVRTPEWFHARDVAAVANDTLTFEIFPPEIEDLWLPVHALDLVEMGMLQGQNWNLEELSTACGQEGRYAFLLSAMPEPFVGGTGTPVAPVAVL